MARFGNINPDKLVFPAAILPGAPDKWNPLTQLQPAGADNPGMYVIQDYAISEFNVDRREATADDWSVLGYNNPFGDPANQVGIDTRSLLYFPSRLTGSAVFNRSTGARFDEGDASTPQLALLSPTDRIGQDVRGIMYVGADSTDPRESQSSLVRLTGGEHNNFRPNEAYALDTRSVLYGQDGTDLRGITGGNANTSLNENLQQGLDVRAFLYALNGSSYERVTAGPLDADTLTPADQTGADARASGYHYDDEDAVWERTRGNVRDITAASAARTGAQNFDVIARNADTALAVVNVSSFTSYTAFRFIAVDSLGNEFILFEDTTGIAAAGQFAFGIGAGIPGGGGGGAGPDYVSGTRLPLPRNLRIEVEGDMTYSVETFLT